MSYPDLRYYITFFIKRYEDFEKVSNSTKNVCKGCPKVQRHSIVKFS